MPWYAPYAQLFLVIQLIDIFNKLGSYILLSSLSQKCQFSSAALQVVVGEIVSASHSVRADRFVQTLVAVCGPQDVLEKLPSEVIKGIIGIPYVFDIGTTMTHD
jgi:U3 small nucleolar RNA-associated protein 10